MNTRTLAPLLTQCLSVCLSVQLAQAQDLTPKAPPQSRPIAIINATVHPVSEPPIENGFVFFDQGVIRGIGTVGSMDAAKIKADEWIIIDAKGKHVYPGLIAPYTQLGLTELSAVRAMNDLAETGAATPEVRACVAVNPDSTLLPVTRSNGVLLAGVFPQGGSGGFGEPAFMPGRASVMRLDGWTWESMTIRDDAGLVVNWPQARPIAAWWMDKSPEEQQNQINRRRAAIEEMFTGAEAYFAAREKDPTLPRDIRFEAMRRVFGSGSGSRVSGLGSSQTQQPASSPPEPRNPNPDTRLPVFIHANDVDQITQALALCEKHSLKCVIVGGFDGPHCAEAIKRAGAWVLVQGTMRFPKRDDSAYDEPYTLGARLEAAGIPWCMASGEEAAHERNLPYAAAMAAAYGLDRAVALRSITLSPAQMLGIADQYGTLAIDKSATLFIADGDILEVETNVERAFIDGRDIDMSDKQKVLAEKYREKYKQKK